MGEEKREFEDREHHIAPDCGSGADGRGGDRAFREICRKYGSACSIGEMTSAKGLIYSDRKSEELLCLGEAERPGAVQLFGDDPKLVAAAAQKALAWNPDWIDINMGCPAPKIAGSGSGSA